MERIGSLIYVFIFIIIGLILASVLADTFYESTNVIGAFNETLDVTAARTGATGDIDGSHAGFALGTSAGRNVTGITSFKAVNGTIFVENTDWNLTIQRLYLMDSTRWTNHSGNDTVVTYNYESDSYIDNSTARTIVNLILIFFVIAIIAFVYLDVRKKYEGFA